MFGEASGRSRLRLVADMPLDSCNSNPKRGDVFGDDHPYHVVGNPMVFVAQDIADAANLFPWNIRRDGQQFVGNVPGCFGDDFQSALDGEAQQPVPFKVAERLSGGMSLDTVDGFQDFG